MTIASRGRRPAGPRLQRRLRGAKRLRRDTAFYRTVVEGTSALVCVIDVQGRIVLVNPALEQSTGWRESELLGRLFVEVLAVPEEAARAAEAIADALATGQAPNQEGEWLDRHGGRRRVAMQNSVLHHRRGRAVAFVIVGLDVTVLRREEAALRRRAETDLLTGLANRGAFFAALEEALGLGAESTGLLFCDLDGFKQANDTHGHAAGDTVLVEMAGRLRRLVGAGNLAARIGGDEFVLLVRQASPERLTALAEQVREAVGRPLRTTVDDTPVEITLSVSVGMAIARPGITADDLVAAADRAMYAAKSSARVRRRSRPGPADPQTP